MPDAERVLGRVAPEVKAYHWFGRPLLLSNRVRGYEGERLKKTIDAELARGCDGFVFRLSAGPTGDAHARQVASFEETLRDYSQAAFVYVEIMAEGIESAVLDVLRRHAFPRGYSVASRSPNALLELYRLAAPWPDGNMSIIVDAEKGFSNVGRCPYTSVEIPDALATHDRVLGIHRSMKEVFVRAAFDEGEQSLAEKALKRIEERVNWLAHEKVDAIISSRTDVLPRLLGIVV